MTLSARARLGPYEIVSLLGGGGMGEVYRARDTRLDRTVAIKVLRDTHSELQARFAREAKVIAALAHPHICTLFDIGHQQGTDYLVMECLEGETLADRLKRGALPIEQSLKTAIEIGDALDKAHRAGVVHRDLKPSNVMITRAGAKLLDFGLAKFRAGSQGVTVTITQAPLSGGGALIGTVPYMAPEQLEGREADARSDLFAFGALLYEMVTGRRAFMGESQASVIAAILETNPPPISTVQTLVPSALDRVVNKCLAKDPEVRWQTARDLVDELKWIAEGMRTTPDVPVAPPRRRWPPVAWLIATGAVLAAIMSVLVLRRFAQDLPVMRLEVSTPLTSDSTAFALSPDGRQLVFVATADHVSRLWLRRLDETTAQAVAGTDGATLPFWAPDSRDIGFFADGKLKRVNLAGGTPLVLAEAVGPGGGTWNREDVILFGSRPQSGLMRVAATGGTPTDVTYLTTGEGFHLSPEFLPDGRHFLFYMQNTGGQNPVSGVYLGSLDVADTHRLVAADTAAVYAYAGYLLFLRKGVLVAVRFDAARGTLSGEPIPVAQGVGSNRSAHGAFSVSATGLLAHRTGGGDRRQLVWFDRSGTEVGSIGSPDENFTGSPELAPNGRQVALSRGVQGNLDIWLIDAAHDLPSRFTFDPGSDGAQVWAPDGSSLIFGSDRNGKYHDLFEKPASGASDEHLVFSSSDDKGPDDWSPDGRTVLYRAQDMKTHRSHLWALPLEQPRLSTGPGHPEPAEGRKPFPVVQTKFDDDEGQFSPDGRWIVYRSTESGQPEIYVRSFPGPGGQRQISAGGGHSPRWPHKGKELFYIAADSKLMAVPIGLHSDGQVLDVGAPVALFPTRLGAVGARPQYAVDDEGQRFLMNVVVDEAIASPITIVQNWTAGLKK